MQAIGGQPQRAPDGAQVHYERHRPEQTTLYRLVQQHAASFIAHTETSTDMELPREPLIPPAYPSLSLPSAVAAACSLR